MTPAGAAAADGARQHLPGGEGRRLARQLLPRGQPRRAARARADVGGRPGRRGARGVPRGATASPGRGRPASGWWSRSPARPGATTSSAARRAWRRGPAVSWSGCTCARPTGLRGPTGPALAEQRNLLQELGGEYHELASADPATALVQFAQSENATQIVLGASRQSRWTHFAARLGDHQRHPRVGPIDIHVISSDAESEARAAAEPAPTPRRPGNGPPPRRRRAWRGRRRGRGDGTVRHRPRALAVSRRRSCSRGSWRSSRRRC